ncbi:AMP-binding protein [Rhizobium halophytocola]|uniref:Acyl-CoA synthetase (AMP-forming)/AMP-acid ligase II n=1 Tax=Rhizobium halophytocola TaxID=735519 RepID=A0ABS4DV78_9HYPH|nr:AMP-binding protein [Rhizobium halophytocola]MBP1849597.1 acyl-CoA synthetase (AMP-forming)/AMP-acid ligase II [Rhizobium halophytocola]
MTNPASPHELLTRQAARSGEKPLLILPQKVADLWDLGQSAWSYRQALDAVETLAGRYRKAGYSLGHRVALLLENRPDHFFHWLALNSLGVSIVPVNPDYKADELHYLLEHSESAALVAVESRHGHVRDVAAGLGVPLVGPDLDDLPQVAAAGDTLTGPLAGETLGRECAVIYTSGTTGRPKGCLLSNAYFLAWGEWYTAQTGAISLREGVERLMTPLPTFHVNAMGNSFMGMLACGGAQVIIDRFHPRDWWESAAETGATCFHYLGVMPAILLEIPPSDLDRAHGLRFGLGGGVHPDHHGVFEARFGVPLLEGWAMTEGGGAALLCAADEPRHVGQRCLGRWSRPGPGIDIRIVDDEGRDCEDGTPGEFLVRAAGDDSRRAMFSGYLKNETATREVWKDGYLNTGDIMRRDADGSLYFVDRKKNIIRRSGENIAAVEVEGAIAAHADVGQVAAVAVLEPLRGEEVLAVVVPRSGVEPGAELARALFDHAAARLTYYKVPGYVVFLDALPTTSTQKVRKQDLGVVATDPMAARHSFDFREHKQRLRLKG